MLRNGRQDGLNAVQEYLRSIEIDMSLSGVSILLENGLQTKERDQGQLYQQKKQASSAGMGQKTPESYGKPVEAMGVF
jgi:hypothetical protein